MSTDMHQTSTVHDASDTRRSQHDLRSRWPSMSTDGEYVVLPRAVLGQLPVAVQNQIAAAQDYVHRITSPAAWPAYRVTPCRWVEVQRLDEGGLREAGLITEIDAHGELVYRDMATGELLRQDQIEQEVLVPAPDPLVTGQAVSSTTVRT